MTIVGDRVSAAIKSLGRAVVILADLQDRDQDSRFKEQSVMLSVGARFVLNADLNPNDGDQTQVGWIIESFPTIVVEAMYFA